MSILALLLATVLATSVGQGLLAMLILRNRWYSLRLRLAIGGFLLISSAGGMWFVLVNLYGGREGLLPGFLLVVGWTCALWVVVAAEARKAVGRGDLERDTNERIREMQIRGQSDRPKEQTDRIEGRQHRSDIDAALLADTKLRSQERKDDREERAEERREDREERAEEGRDS